MRPVGITALLEVLDECAPLDPTRRAARLADLADPDGTASFDLPLGVRDDRLLDLRERVLGPRLDAVAACPTCAEQLQVDVPVASLRSSDEAGTGELEVESAGLVLRIRPLTSNDLLEAQGCVDVSEAHQLLLSRCLVAARRDGRPVAADDVPGSVAPAVEAALHALDPDAERRLSLTCPACGHAWDEEFDVATFLWSELERWARGVFEDVHRLARAYGWTETDILQLSPARRRRYLELIASG